MTYYVQMCYFSDSSMPSCQASIVILEMKKEGNNNTSVSGVLKKQEP